MSWTLGYPEIKNASVSEAKELLGAQNAPDSIKAYVGAGIDGLVARFGEDVKVTISGHGHLCDGPNSYEVTTASVAVRKAE